MEIDSNLRINFTSPSKLPEKSEFKNKIHEALDNALHTLMYDLDIEVESIHCFFIDDFDVFDVFEEDD